MKRKAKSSTAIPKQCLELGFAGYAADGWQPTETVWAGHVADRLATVGCYVIPNVAGSMHSGEPDAMLHTNAGLYYLEFKGMDTPIRGNQAAIAVRYNAKSFYSRGEFVVFVYKAPDLLGVLKSDATMLKLGTADALKDPHKFLELIEEMAQPVGKRTSIEDIEAIVLAVGLPVLPISTYKVSSKRFANAMPDETVTHSYTAGLAMKQVTGLTPNAALSIIFSGDGAEYRSTEI